MVSVAFSVGGRSKVPYVLIGSKTYVSGEGGILSTLWRYLHVSSIEGIFATLRANRILFETMYR